MNWKMSKWIIEDEKASSLRKGLSLTKWIYNLLFVPFRSSTRTHHSSLWPPFTRSSSRKSVLFNQKKKVPCLSICFARVCVGVCVHAHAQWFSHVWLFATPWTVVHQAPLSTKFSRQEYWSELAFPPPGDLSDPGIKPMSPMSPALREDSLPAESLRKLFDSVPFSKDHFGETTILPLPILTRPSKGECASSGLSLGIRCLRICLCSGNIKYMTHLHIQKSKAFLLVLL